MDRMKSKTRPWPVFGLVGRRTVPNFSGLGAWCAPSLAAIAATLLAFFAGGPIANAQTTIEVEKITCIQFLTFAVADPNQIGIWLSGYFHGRHGDKILRVQDLRKNLETLKTACYLSKNSELSVMEVSETLFPSK
jgi:hypothetical protein